MVRRSVLALCAVGAGFLPGSAGTSALAAEREPRELRTMVEADWAAQEKRYGRSPDSAAALRDALRRGRLLLADMAAMDGAPDLTRHAGELARLRQQAKEAASLDGPARAALYRQLRWLTRRAALANPLLAGKEILFLKRRRFICQMLHEYHGYWYDKVSGGGVAVLRRPGRSLAVRDLTAGRPGEGTYTTLSLSYDARTVYFAFVHRGARTPEYRSPDWMAFACLGRGRTRRPRTGWRCFHVHAMGADGRNVRQLTDGPNDDFDPCPLPDGGIAFLSTRRGGYTRCNNDWEPLPVYTLHRMGADGGGVRTLSFHETNEWHPTVLNDGRIAYTRWDYVDRSAANFHGIWITNPDGTGPVSVFGNYTRRINACFQPRVIPGSRKIAFLAGAHHADVGGSLVIVDPDRVALDRTSGEDRFESLEVLTPWICFPEAPGFPDSYVHSPWPLSENYFLLAYSHDPLPGMSARTRKDVPTGLYYLDRFGNLELLYREKGISCMYPIPLAPRPKPPVVPSSLDENAGDEGVFVLSDVRRGLFGLPDGRPIRALRVFQMLPKTWTHTNNRPRIGHANAESARLLVGEVPVEADGSACFRAPARKALCFQAVDAAGRAVHTMRSVTYLQPGERRGCVGCHEPRADAPRSGAALARRRDPLALKPGPDGTKPFCYARLIQPILKRHCVRCHDGRGEAKKRPVLTGEAAGEFTRSYASLRPYLRWYEWGGASIRQNLTKPGACGADASRLTKVLEAHARAGRAKLRDAELRRLYVWLDGNVPFYGVYADAARRAQQQGKAVPVPPIQ